MRTIIVTNPPVGIVRISDTQARYLLALLRKDEETLRCDIHERTIKSAEKALWVEYFHVGYRVGYRLTKAGRGIAKKLAEVSAEREWPAMGMP